MSSQCVATHAILSTKMADHWRGKRVLELGSGLGHLGWGLYQLGAHVTCTDTPLGDLEPLRKRVDKWLDEEVRNYELPILFRTISNNIERQKASVRASVPSEKHRKEQRYGICCASKKKASCLWLGLSHAKRTPCMLFSLEDGEACPMTSHVVPGAEVGKQSRFKQN
jgi:hypothetical protein